MTQRYEVDPIGDGEAILFDTKEGHPVMTEGGDIYSAPIENAAWVAAQLNSKGA